MSAEQFASYESVYTALQPPAVVGVSLHKPEQGAGYTEPWGYTEPNPGPASYVGRRAPSYPPEPTGLPPASKADLYATMLPDTEVDGGTFGGTEVRAASVRGDSHRYRNECRQDAMAVARIGGTVLLLVADGLGSQPFSHRGSNRIGRLLAKQMWQMEPALRASLQERDETAFSGLANRVVADAAAELRGNAEREGLDPQTYSTTMRALLVPVDPEVRVRGFVSVGDGGLSRLRDGGWTSLDRSADGGPVLDSATDCLPGPYRHAYARLITDGLPGDVLVLSTDGFSLPLAGEPELRSRLARQWGGPDVPGLAEFLWQAQVRARSYDDDRTVVCLWEGR